MISPKGRFCITRSRIEEFYNLYQINTYGLTEMPRDYSMLRFDFDIKVKLDNYNNEKRFYSDKDIVYIIHSINNGLKRIIDIKDDALICCLLEKDIYLKQDKNVYSGGFHLQYPSIFTKNEVVMTLINDIKSDVKSNTDIDFDAGVYRNPWLMYGSKKDIDLKPYLLTKIYNVDINEMSPAEAFKDYKLFNVDEDYIVITENNVESLLPRILSINQFGRNNEYDALPNKVVSSQIKFVEKPKRADNREIDDKLKEADRLLNLLKASRVDEYADWMTIGWILFSIGEGCEQALDLWDKVSQKSDNYDDCACATQWSSMKIGKYTIATLHKFAKEDSPIEYANLFKKKDDWMRELIVNMSDTHCAEVFKDKNNGELFFTRSNGWIIYNKDTCFWTFNNDKSSLTYTVSKFFSNVIKDYQIEYTKNYNPSVKADDEFLQMIGKTRLKVEMSKFSAGVITQLQGLLTEDDSIMSKFDSNPSLFAFKCGNVYDLEKREFRRITKDDYIITHCGYSVPDRNEGMISNVKAIISSMCRDQEQLKTVLSMLSLFVYGNNINEVFFVLTGSGGNGKGLLDTFLQQSLGSYYKPVDMKQFTHYEKDGNRANSEIASCQYARCVSASESEASKDNKLITSQIKKYSGNDSIQTRYLHKDQFSFKPKFTMLMSLNDIPSLSIMDGGVQRRMKICELPYKFIDNLSAELGVDEKYADVTLKTKISMDHLYRDAFLYILFDTWYDNKGKFYENTEVKEYTASYFECQNPVKAWFARYYVECDETKVKANTLFGEANESLSITQTQFGRYMKEVCKSKKTKEGTFYLCKPRPYQTHENVIELL
jgi:P4 family phage/plasmid primase-like protien